ncbi:hypothetical protein SLEP1_g27566 [Rubroshorea leprosula]|uniref:Uncharacterized protein n=1 Tax=Rubroshorea leprosula TaxID=152421 RepID=A0AAV5K1L3_9ROSI|nr:hypothetical protein SLEP1_g27566 [Rubroshorea leprosula]
MEFFRELGELRGNQGKEEEESVMSVKPIAMIVSSELQDLSETSTLESSASSSAHEGFGGHHSLPSKGSSLERTASAREGVGEGHKQSFVGKCGRGCECAPVAGWENKTISGRLSNLRKAPQTLGAGFRFRANLHHEVADSATSIKGYKRLEDIVRQYHVPRTILIRIGTRNKRACTVSQTRWIPVYVDHFNASLRFPLPGLIFDILAELEILARAVVFRSLFLCRLSPTRTRWHYISGREKMMIFNYVRNKVSRWKRQFVFVKDTRTERIRAEGLVDLEALVTPEVLTMHGFMDVAILFSEGEMSSMLERQRERAQRSQTRVLGLARIGRRALTSDCLCAREDSNVEDDMPLIRCRLNFGTQSGAALSYSVALFENEQAARGQNCELNDTCKRLTSDKASLEDEVNHLQSLEMADKAASAESWADELANKVNQLKEELKKDVVAVASMNTTTEIFNDVCQKVLKYQSDFPIGKLAFVEGEEFDEEGKSLASPTDTIVRLRWELNEDGLPIWPPSILEEGEDFENLPRFDSWVGDAPEEEAEPSRTPPTPQPITTATVPSPARADASVPIDSH